MQVSVLLRVSWVKLSFRSEPGQLNVLARPKRRRPEWSGQE